MFKKISIITPVYNAGVYWERAYDSINRQTLKEIEWLLIDDGSTDGTYEALNNLAIKDTRIKLFSREHGGAGAARNYGMAKATGEYIAFLDIDDEYYEPTALERMYNAGIANKADVICGFRINDAFYGMTKVQMFDGLGEIDPNGVWVDFKDYQEDYHFHSYLFKRDYIINNRFIFPDYKRYQDPVFCLKVLDNVQKVLVVPATVYKYTLVHQKPELISYYISEVLKGIKDNLLIAYKKDYKILFEKLIDRLNCDYYSAILRNFGAEKVSG